MKRPCAGDKLVADHDGRGVLQDFAGVGGELSAVARRVIECDIPGCNSAAPGHSASRSERGRGSLKIDRIVDGKAYLKAPRAAP
jgi:hypothetical protein